MYYPQFDKNNKMKGNMGKSRWKITDVGRQCSSCTQFLDWTHFGQKKHGTRGRDSSCLICVASAKRHRDKIKRDRETQPCWICGYAKQAKDFFRATGTVGRQFFCNSCHKNNRDDVNKYFPTSLCASCNRVTYRENFYPNAAYFDGCHHTCKECARARRNRYYADNKEKNIACVLNSRAKNREAFEAYGKKYRSENKDKIKKYTQARRARLLGADTDVELSVLALRSIHGDLCYFCKVPMVFEGWDRYKIDPAYATHEHLQPLSRGGSNTFDNSVLCCHRCNTRKQAKTEKEFFAYLERNPK